MAAVSKSLGDLNDRSRRANEIERKLAAGQTVIELETGSIDPSFVQDRMEGDIDGLLGSIREQGQQVPILVRPHPHQSGRYQVAFGHRRLRAVAELGISIKAIVRDLTDEQLVIAQGQENNERKDLSFIEKARFAARLREQFPREVIISSMSLDKGNLSKMLSIIDSLPPALVEAIGAAPGIGSPNWQQMVELFEKSNTADDLVAFAQSSEVQALPSADRFKAVLALKPRRVSRGAPDVLAAPDGERLAQVKKSKAKVEIIIDRKATPDFAAFILEHVPALYAEHRAKQQKKEA
jgi:ParB family transcriptional regulator, chromosome partitioning protein